MKALIIVDMQNDFCPGGALPVKDGDRIVSLINHLQKQFRLVVATQDWHPAGHKSFASQHNKKVGEVIELNGLPQVLWPDHCVQGTAGAEFVPGLKTDKIDRVFQKGVDPEIDSYSGFFDNGHLRNTGLGDYLKSLEVEQVFIVGLATDYCVKFTALDAAKFGFKTAVIEDATRGVELKAGDVQKAKEKMKAAGVLLIKASQILPS